VEGAWRRWPGEERIGVGLNRFCRETDNQEILEVLEEKRREKLEEARRETERQDMQEEMNRIKLDKEKEALEIKEVLDTSLECPICTEEMKPPRKIFQCSNGHVICELCKINPKVVILCSVIEVIDLAKD
jgi:hypothetical protein